MVTTLNAFSRVLVIGGGRMGEAMVAGWLRAADGAAAALSPQSFTVVNPGQEKRDHLTEAYGVGCVADLGEIDNLATFDLVVLAVKPQVLGSVLEVLARRCASLDNLPLFVSVAAGITTARIEGALGSQAAVVRVMPNTPLLIGHGASTLCGGSRATDAQLSLVRDLFASMGSAFIVDEALMDATGAISGSGPAYMAAFVEALRDAGVSAGLSPELAEGLALSTMEGTAALMMQPGATPEQTRIAVCSPGGTTLAALGAMENAGFAQAVDAGVAAAVKRSKELASC